MRCDVIERQLSEALSPQTSPQQADTATKPKNDCNPQAMAALESRCKVVMQQCTIGLLNVLSVREYKDVEGELAFPRCEPSSSPNNFHMFPVRVPWFRWMDPEGERDFFLFRLTEALNQNICSYLTCERYWEEGPRETRFSPFLATTIGFLLASGFFGCYWVVWIAFE